MTTDEIMDFADCYSNSPFIEGSEDDIRYRRKTRSALLKAVEELARDAARINFLESTKKEHTLCLGSTWYSRSGYSQPITKHKTLRDAIDAAMKETP